VRQKLNLSATILERHQATPPVIEGAIPNRDIDSRVLVESCFQLQEGTYGTTAGNSFQNTMALHWRSEVEQFEEPSRKQPKPVVEAYEALLGILKSKQLRLGDYREVVKVRVPKVLPHRVKETKQTEKPTSMIVRLLSAPVCCIADIPVAHLFYHAKRYGKIAIGFHRQAVVQRGFNPVFYTLYDTTVLRSVRAGFKQLRDMAGSLSTVERNIQYEIERQIDDLECEHGHKVDDSRFYHSVDIGFEMEDIGEAVKKAQTSLREFLAFVKTFTRQELSTIYCERKWRSTQHFSFRMDDVAMIVLPKASAGISYFNQFVTEAARGLKFPRSIPVVPWEDLVEH
jgi:hypothetical protein